MSSFFFKKPEGKKRAHEVVPPWARQISSTFGSEAAVGYLRLLPPSSASADATKVSKKTAIRSEMPAYIPYRPGVPVRTPSKQYSPIYEDIPQPPSSRPQPRNKEPPIPQFQTSPSYTNYGNRVAPVRSSAYMPPETIGFTPSLPLEPIPEPPQQPQRVSRTIARESKRRQRSSVEPDAVPEFSVAVGAETRRRPESQVLQYKPLPIVPQAESSNGPQRRKAKATERVIQSSKPHKYRIGKALEDFKAKESREMTVNKGETITDLEPDSWYGQTKQGIRGGFSGVYVQVIDEFDFSKGAIATRDCRYHNFRAGEFLSHLERQPDGSYLGRNELGVSGRIPGSYAQLVDHRDITKGAFALKDYRFHSFRKGDFITDLRLTWWRGVNPRGEVGCIPVKLVEVIDEEIEDDTPPISRRNSGMSKRSSTSKQIATPAIDADITPITIDIPCVAPSGKKWMYTLQDCVDVSIEDLRLMAAQHLNIVGTGQIRLALDDFVLRHDTWRIPTEQLAELCRKGTKIYTKLSDYLFLRYGEDVHILRFEAKSIERGVLFMSRVRDEAAVVMGKGFRSYPKESMRLSYMGNEISRNVPVTWTVRQEGIGLGAWIVCELLQREDRKQYARDCEREVLEWGVRPKTLECAVCGDEKIIKDGFPDMITAKCRHDVHTCKKCLQAWIASQLDTAAWDMIHCPECKRRLKHGDVKKYAVKDVFLRFVLSVLWREDPL
jgi:hypothetical protein